MTLKNYSRFIYLNISFIFVMLFNCSVWISPSGHSVALQDLTLSSRTWKAKTAEHGGDNFHDLTNKPAKTRYFPPEFSDSWLLSSWSTDPSIKGRVCCSTALYLSPRYWANIKQIDLYIVRPGGIPSCFCYSHIYFIKERRLILFWKKTHGWKTKYKP